MTEQEHRNKTLELYRNQLPDSGEFMKVILKEAIRKLIRTEIHPNKIESWVVKLENDWRNI